MILTTVCRYLIDRFPVMCKISYNNLVGIGIHLLGGAKLEYSTKSICNLVGIGIHLSSVGGRNENIVLTLAPLSML